MPIPTQLIDAPEFVTLGAGAMGTTFAVHLARAGHLVAMLVRAQRANQIRADSLRLTGLVDFGVRVPADAAALLQSDIRGSQQSIVKHPEFKRLSRQAGCISYVAWIAGRQVTYFGRGGETHVENSPRSGEDGPLRMSCAATATPYVPAR